ncbi:hypothetical protein [uncultured Cetobacterium sp.]|uniref:toxin-antitoxin system YwqK family antitoxin n=1 Tax=uncultured Cetobacterium sp. TaxID=527638 RepID=UPI002630B875|nr:hypothetical protein [uncultured Cetobacterium sp.]
MKASNKKLIIGICIAIFIFLTSFTSKIKRREGYIGVYPSLNFKGSSNSSEGTFYILLKLTVGPLVIPIYMLDRTSSFIYDTILFPIDAYKDYKASNGKITKYYEDEFRVQWIGRGEIKPLYTDKKRLEYTLKNGKYIGEYYEYFEDGSIKEFSNWKNGELDGVKKTYYSSKEIQTDEVWKDNQLISLVYYDSGDKRTGFKEIKYSENGDIIYECVLSEEEEKELYKKFYKSDN